VPAYSISHNRDYVTFDLCATPPLVDESVDVALCELLDSEFPGSDDWGFAVAREAGADHILRVWPLRGVVSMGKLGRWDECHVCRYASEAATLVAHAWDAYDRGEGSVVEVFVSGVDQIAWNERIAGA
jgi:hypothetical protein